MMSDVRPAGGVLEDAEPVVEAITGSVLRNSGCAAGPHRHQNKDDYTFLHSVSVYPDDRLRALLGWRATTCARAASAAAPRHRQDEGARMRCSTSRAA